MLIIKVFKKKFKYIKTCLWLLFYFIFSNKEQKLFTLPYQHLPSIAQFLAFPKVEISRPWKKPCE